MKFITKICIAVLIFLLSSSFKEKEKKILKELQPKMMKARMGMQQQMQKKIKASDLNMARFREIAITLRQSKELSKRFKQFQQPAGGMGQ